MLRWAVVARRRVVSVAARVACVAVAAALAGGCGPGDELAAADLSAMTDAAMPGAWLTSASGSRPLAAWYGFYVQPLTDEGTAGTLLVVTLVDPAFRCDGSAATGLDALSIGFAARQPGVSAIGVIARVGPTLGPTTAQIGWAELTAVDDRFGGEDGGVVIVAPGGHVAGEAHYQLAPDVRVDGTFDAPHCSFIDFVAEP
jgi:hypothetical protein